MIRIFYLNFYLLYFIFINYFLLLFIYIYNFIFYFIFFTICFILSSLIFYFLLLFNFLCFYNFFYDYYVEMFCFNLLKYLISYFCSLLIFLEIYLSTYRLFDFFYFLFFLLKTFYKSCLNLFFYTAINSIFIFYFNIVLFLICFRVIFKFLNLCILNYGSSIRREDWYLYQYWFKFFKGRSDIELRRMYNFNYLRDEELKTHFFKNVTLSDSSFKPIPVYYTVASTGEKFFKKMKYIWFASLKLRKEDRFRSVYFYYLHLNERYLSRRVYQKKILSQYKEKYGTYIFDELVSKNDQKMAKNVSIKLTRDGNFIDFKSSSK